MEQLNLCFEPGVSRKHRSLQLCCAAWVYRLGFGAIALDIDQSPGNLSNMLSDEKTRKFGVDDMEKVLDKYQDFEPIWYLIDKYLKNKTNMKNTNLMSEAEVLISQLRGALKRIQDAGE